MSEINITIPNTLLGIVEKMAHEAKTDIDEMACALLLRASSGDPQVLVEKYRPWATKAWAMDGKRIVKDLNKIWGTR